jgi:3-methyladenine DNA glycosylase/8-oxoguanine DNA glycosylase
VPDAANAANEVPLEMIVALANGSDALATIGMLWQGPPDAQMRIAGNVVWRASRFPRGPATLELRIGRDRVAARAWGPGASDALDTVAALVGERDDPSQLLARHDAVARARRRMPGLRLTSGAPLYETLLFSILGQKVTSYEARQSFGALIRRFGDRAPGPMRLMVPPAPNKLAQTPYWAFHALGLERRRADTIRAAAAAAHRFPSLAALPTAERITRLTSRPGIGPWTAAEATRLAFGDPDAVSVGDYHLPGIVCWSLAGERNGTDERMLELLEPYSGQRARVVLLIEHAGIRYERHAPRMAPRSIAGI